MRRDRHFRSRLSPTNGMRQRAVAIGVLTIFFSVTAQAQADVTRNQWLRALERAIQLGNGGETAAARAAVDSLIAGMPSDSPDLAELLFVRASLVPSVVDADLDYKKIVSDFPESPWRESSLLRLAQRALMAGDVSQSIEYLHELSSAYRSDSSQARVSYWLAQALLETRDISAACAASDQALRHASSAPPALQGRIEEQARTKCRRPVTAITSGPPTTIDDKPRTVATIPRGTPGKTSVNAGTGKNYAVQVAAFGTRADAEEMAGRLRKSGLAAHVDGNVRPFRVRIGNNATYGEAAASLRDLRKRKLDGFIAEIPK